MTKRQERQYEDTEILRQILLKMLKDRKFTLDCGHHVSLFHNLGNDITIYNGKKPKIICTQCGY
jgi:hypothetical protein